MTAGSPSGPWGEPTRLLPLAQAIRDAAGALDAPRIADLAAQLRDHARALERRGARGDDDLRSVVAALTTLRAIATDIEAERRHLSARRARDRRVRLAYGEAGPAPASRQAGSGAAPRARPRRSVDGGARHGAAAGVPARAGARRRE